MPSFQRPIVGYGVSFEERSDKRLTEIGGRGCALGSLNLVLLACSYRFTQVGLLERALAEVAEESSRCVSSVATRYPYVLQLQEVFLRFCGSQCMESEGLLPSRD